LLPGGSFNSGSYIVIFRGLTLDPFQEDAITALSEGHSVLVCAPTGTGKTIIADWIVDRALTRDRDVIYTAPVKALSNQKFRDWCRAYGEDRVGLLTGDLVIRRDARCRVMTTEILRNMLLAGEELPELDAVIIDEIHFLDDRERGTTWEELLIYLPNRVQIVGLSATLSNANSFAAWISSIRETEVRVIRQEQRAVPLEPWIGNLDEGLLTPRDFDRAHVRWRKRHHPRGGGRHRGPTTSHVDVFDQVSDRGWLPALYFAFSRKATEQYARNLARRVRRSLLTAEERAVVRERLDKLASTDPGLVDGDLRELYESGIAFHHAGLHVTLKAFVEELYESRLLRILYCTSTFALGINMPARTVVFDGLRKFDGTSMRALTTREFLQKAGRAGRRGLDTVGHVVIRMDHPDWEEASAQLLHYFQGKPEPVRSSFSLSFNSVVNLVARNPLERIRSIVEKSFLNYHRQLEARRLLEDADRLLDGPAGKKAAKEAARMRHRAQSRAGQCWDEFQAKVSFLQSIGYLGEGLELQAGGKALQHVQIEEIFITELFLAGMLEAIPPELLFGLLCAVNKEFGRDVHVRMQPRPEVVKLARAAEKVRWSPAVTKAEEVSQIQVTWCPAMIPFGVLWAEGKTFPDLLSRIDSLTDVSGDLVGAFRRAKDLAGQLKDVYADDPARREVLSELIRRVSRDEVLVVD